MSISSNYTKHIPSITAYMPSYDDVAEKATVLKDLFVDYTNVLTTNTTVAKLLDSHAVSFIKDYKFEVAFITTFTILVYKIRNYFLNSLDQKLTQMKIDNHKVYFTNSELSLIEIQILKHENLKLRKQKISSEELFDKQIKLNNLKVKLIEANQTLERLQNASINLNDLDAKNLNEKEITQTKTTIDQIQQEIEKLK